MPAPSAQEETTIQQIRKRNKSYVVDRQGKEFVLYAGLLDHAHHNGLKSIKTNEVQIGNEHNGGLSVVKAVVELEDGRVFTGFGDASPENVGRMIALHCFRMAETRAKARALRDAMNVGGACLEELGPENEDDAPAVEERRPTPIRRNLEEQDLAEQVEAEAPKAPRAKRNNPQAKADATSVSSEQGTSVAQPKSGDREAVVRPANSLHVAIWDELHNLDPEQPAPEAKNAEGYESVISDALVALLLGGKNKTPIKPDALHSLTIANTWSTSKGVVLPLDGDLKTVDGQGALKVIALLRRAKDVFAGTVPPAALPL